MRERNIEKYLHQKVLWAGGTTRKFIGRTNDTDRLVLWPTARVAWGKGDIQIPAEVHFVECKATKKKPRAGQLREHARLRKMGFKVFVLSSTPEIDDYTRDQYAIFKA